MTTMYDNQYYFVRRDKENPRLSILKADVDTSARNYWFEPQPPTSKPLVFTNGWRERFREEGIREQIPSIIFAGVNFVVKSALRQQLLALDIPSLLLHPAIYIDDADQWHEDLWFVSFSARFACWDRQRSTFLPDTIDIGTRRRYEILTYSLDDAILDRTPLRERLLFQMAETGNDMIVCHQSIAPLFRQDGVHLQPITEY